jgi:excisionase family DNA binding protein
MDLLTTEEAAEFLHVPLPSLRHWLATSQAPPSARIGKRRMFRRSDLEAFVEAKFAAAAKQARP